MTRDDKTRDVIATVKKVRLGNLDVYSPKRAADWRISVNVEVPGAYILISVAMGETGSQHPLQCNTHWVRRCTHVEKIASAILTKNSSST